MSVLQGRAAGRSLPGIWKRSHPSCLGKDTQGPSFLPSCCSPAFSVPSPVLPVPPCLLSLQSFPALSSFHPASSFPIPCHSLLSTVFLSILAFSSSSLLPFPLLCALSVVAWGPGLLRAGPSGSFSLNLTISHMSIRRGSSPCSLPPFPGPAAMLRPSTICCVQPGAGRAFCCPGEAELSGSRR